MPGPFLTARWESLVFLNYACPRAWPDPLVPRGTELDTWQGQTLVSLVGFLFAGTRLKGLPVPGHRTFEEVKLRFYVRRTTPAGELAATATGPARPSSSRSTTGAIPGSVTRAPWNTGSSSRRGRSGRPQTRCSTGRAKGSMAAVLANCCRGRRDQRSSPSAPTWRSRSAPESPEGAVRPDPWSPVPGPRLCATIPSARDIVPPRLSHPEHS
jgi:hypothetical protein